MGSRGCRDGSDHAKNQLSGRSSSLRTSSSQCFGHCSRSMMSPAWWKGWQGLHAISQAKQALTKQAVRMTSHVTPLASYPQLTVRTCDQAGVTEYCVEAWRPLKDGSKPSSSGLFDYVAVAALAILYVSTSILICLTLIYNTSWKNPLGMRIIVALGTLYIWIKLNHVVRRTHPFSPCHADHDFVTSSVLRVCDCPSWTRRAARDASRHRPRTVLAGSVVGLQSQVHPSIVNHGHRHQRGHQEMGCPILLGRDPQVRSQHTKRGVGQDHCAL